MLMLFPSLAYGQEQLFHGGKISIDVPEGYKAVTGESKEGDFVCAGYVISDDGSQRISIYGTPYDGEHDYLYGDDDTADFYEAAGRETAEALLSETYTVCGGPEFFRGNNAGLCRCEITGEDKGYVYMLPEDNSVQILVCTGFSRQEADDMVSSYISYGFYKRTPALYGKGLSAVWPAAAAVLVIAAVIAAAVRKKK